MLDIGGLGDRVEGVQESGWRQGGLWCPKRGLRPALLPGSHVSSDGRSNPLGVCICDMGLLFPPHPDVGG